MAADTAPSHRGPAVLGFVLFFIALSLAMTVDVPRAMYGLKSDEATYVAATLSAAYDRDLAFQQRDLERFAGLYHSGPDGIFLKRGKVLRLRVRAPFPFVHLDKKEDPRQDRVYFGKSLAYSVLAAPFVRLLGLNGLLVFHVVLLGIAGVVGYVFLAAQMRPVSAATFVAAFFGASSLPLYAAFFMPDLFNFTLVMLAYFLWLYKEVRPTSAWAGGWTDIAAAIVLGVAIYSKPLPTGLLLGPPVVLAWTRRQWTRGVMIGAITVAVTGLCFAGNAAVSGEFNYQGGDRKYMVARFPFDTPQTTWNDVGGTVTTDSSTPTEVLTSSELPLRFVHNVEYFLFGRHFGFVPYFFPGVVVMLWWLASPARNERWRQLAFAGVLLSALGLLIYLPWTWNGGGGSPGNRYFFAAYPLLLFLLPPGSSVMPGVLAWIGGAMFTAKILTSPFAAAKYPYLLVEKGPLHRLPVELTMSNDLPVRLAQPLRGLIQYRYDPGVRLYFLDQNAWPPEPKGMWISGSGRADIIVRCAWPIDHLEVEAESPIHTTLTLTFGGDATSVRLEPFKVATFNLKASGGVHGYHDYDYLLTARSSEGFVPHLLEPANMDYRNLGAQIRFRAALVSEGTASPK